VSAGHSFWIIVSGNTPTSFRARHSEDLLPTLRQLQRTQPDTVLKWFERGRLWDSPEAAREDLRARRRTASGRNREWRPGGDHKDPRARFKIPRDVKRARFKERQWGTGGHGKGPGKPGPWPKAQGTGGPKRGPEPADHETKPVAPPDQNAPPVPPELRRGPGKPLGGWTPDVRPRGPGHRPERPGGRPPFKQRPPRPWSKGGWRPREDRGRPDNRGRRDDRGRPDNHARRDDRGRPDDRGRRDDRGRPDDRAHRDDRGRPENRGRSNERNRSEQRGRSNDRERSEKRPDQFRPGGRRFDSKPRKPRRS
jgi:hypothetical protein